MAGFCQLSAVTVLWRCGAAVNDIVLVKRSIILHWEVHNVTTHRNLYNYQTRKFWVSFYISTVYFTWLGFNTVCYKALPSSYCESDATTENKYFLLNYYLSTHRNEMIAYDGAALLFENE